MTKPISMQKTRPPVAMLAGPKIHMRASTGDMSELCSKLRKIVTRAVEESLDSFATLYCDIDGQTMIERGRPASDVGGKCNIRVGVYGPFVLVSQIREDVSQHLRDLGVRK